MSKEKYASLIKTMKWLPNILGVVLIVFAAVALLIDTEDPNIKNSILVFAGFSFSALALMVMGFVSFAVLGKLEEINGYVEKEDENEKLD